VRVLAFPATAHPFFEMAKLKIVIAEDDTVILKNMTDMLLVYKFQKMKIT
jgi:hypothetical protein